MQEPHFHVEIIPLGLGSTSTSVDYRFSGGPIRDVQQRSLLEPAADDSFLGTAGGTVALGHIGDISPCIGPLLLNPNLSDPNFSRYMLWNSSFLYGILRGHGPRMLFDLSTIHL